MTFHWIIRFSWNSESWQRGLLIHVWGILHHAVNCSTITFNKWSLIRVKYPKRIICRKNVFFWVHESINKLKDGRLYLFRSDSFPHKPRKKTSIPYIDNASNKQTRIQRGGGGWDLSEMGSCVEAWRLYLPYNYHFFGSLCSPVSGSLI